LRHGLRDACVDDPNLAPHSLETNVPKWLCYDCELGLLKREMVDLLSMKRVNVLLRWMILGLA
jgi:hypothetical protein